MSSFRWRLLINITLSYILTFLIYSALVVVFSNITFIHLTDEVIYIIAFCLSLIIFLVVFFDLMDITLQYITTLNDTIQQVTSGDYNVSTPIEYDDELGLLAANINALALTLKEKNTESLILKENERLAYDAERNAEQQKNALITNVAHDLRTPLTTVIGYLDLIMNNPDLTREEIYKYSSIAFDKSKRLQMLMDDLFEFTKLEQTDIKVDFIQLNISELLLQIVDEFYPTFQEHDLAVHIDISQPHLIIKGDGMLLARLFDNLLSNAVKYGDDHSDVTIQMLNSDTDVTIKVINKGKDRKSTRLNSSHR